MFTVLLLSDRSERLLERWRELFLPFEDEGGIAFCTWNQGSTPETLEQAVPDLASAIKGKPEWRALVLGTGFESHSGSDYLARDNPFDFDAATGSPGSGTARRHLDTPSPYPLVRLTHMLLGFPELGPKGFDPEPSFLDADTGVRVYLTEFLSHTRDGSDRDERLQEFWDRWQTGHHPKIHYRVIEPSAEEQRAHAQLTRLYEAQQTRPTEVVAVALRQPRTEILRHELLAAWDRAAERLPSRFVERNGYPASCRFAVFDMKPKGYAGLDLEEMRLCLGLLTLAVNDLPASGLQSDRLYRLDVALDDETMGQALNSHLGQLVDMRDYIDARLKAQLARPRTPVSQLLANATVTVDFDRIRGEDLRVSLQGYSLATDQPSSEAERWRASINDLRLHAGRFLREPSRALEQAVAETHQKTTAQINNTEPLSDLDIAELQEELAGRSDSLVRRATDQIIDTAGLQELISEQDRLVSQNIQERMDSRSISLVIAVVLACWCAALGPYLLGALFNGAVNLAESLLVAGVVAGAVLGISYLTLEVMRRQLLGLIRGLNSDLRRFVADVTKGAQDYGAFLSDLVTYAGGRRRLIAEQRRTEALRAEQVKLRQLQRRIEERIELEKSLVRSVGQPIHIEKGSQWVSEIEKLGLSHAQQVMLWVPHRVPCEFNKSGDQISAPYSFIERLSVQDLVLHEPHPPAEAERPESPADAPGGDPVRSHL